MRASVVAAGLILSGGFATGQRHEGHADIVFADGTHAAGIDFVHVNGASDDRHFVEIMGSGGLFFDFDGDGWTDLFLVDGGSLVDPAHGARHRLYRNRGDGRFEDVTHRSGIVHREYGQGACAADYDNDGWDDLYVTNFGQNRLYRNGGDGTFTDVTQAAGLADAGIWSTSCAFADFTRSGHVDLIVTHYVTASLENNPFCGHSRPWLRVYCGPFSYEPLPNVLYRNDGDGTFTDVSAASGIGRVRAPGLALTVADVDHDGWPDVFVANDGVPDFLFRNLGHGRFEEVGLPAGVAVASDGRPRAGMGAAFGDHDGDGLPDKAVTNYEREMHSLFRNLGDVLFADMTVPSGVGPITRPYLGFGVAFLDYDNDGRLDLAIANGHVLDNVELFRPGTSTAAQRNLLLRNCRRRAVHRGRARGRPGIRRRQASTSGPSLTSAWRRPAIRSWPTRRCAPRCWERGSRC